MAAVSGASGQLSGAFAQSVAQTVESSLLTLGCIPVQPGLPEPPNNPLLGEAVLLADSDKLVLVHLLSDDLIDYGDGGLDGTWDPSLLLEEAQRRLSDFRDHVPLLSPDVNEVLHLVLIQPFGRGALMPSVDGRELVSPDRLVMTAADLETIALLEEGHFLLLRQYARASSALRERVHVVRIGRLE